MTGVGVVDVDVDDGCCGDGGGIIVVVVVVNLLSMVVNSMVIFSYFYLSIYIIRYQNTRVRVKL